MKKLLLIILLISFYSCNEATLDPTKTRTTEAIDWLESAAKPIIINKTESVYIACYHYTFIDSDGKVYSTGLVRLDLPPVLKSKKVPDELQ